MGFDKVVALKALAEKNRLQVVVLLAARGEVCACKLLTELPISQSTLSHHMKVLQDAGLVVCRKQGKWSHYSLVPTAMNELASLFEQLTHKASTPDSHSYSHECE